MAVNISKLNEIEVRSRALVSLSEKAGIEVEPGSELGQLFPTQDIKKMTDDILQTTNCEVLQAKIDEHIRELKDMIKASQSEADALGTLKELFKIPSNPLKIISWVKKFVKKYLLGQVSKMIDFIQQIVELVQALKQLIATIQFAQEKLLVCAESIKVNTLDTVIDEALDLVGTSQQELDQLLFEFGEIQQLASVISGQPPVFNVSSASAFIADIKNGGKEKLEKQINDYVSAPLEDVSISLTMTGDVTGSASTDADGNFTISTTAPPPPASQSITVLAANGSPISIDVFA